MIHLSHKRHIAKTITWRALGTLDTIVLSWFITGNPLLGLKIGAVEVFSKMILYYLHERFWFSRNFKESSFFDKSRNRHLAKTGLWRIIGTCDTFLITWILSGNPLTGFKIGAAELVTKMFLYYFHERLWYRSTFGLNQKNEDGKKYSST